MPMDILKGSNKYIPALTCPTVLMYKDCMTLNHFTHKPSYTKVFGTQVFYKGGGDWAKPPSMISKTVDSTTFNFRRPLGL